MATIPCDKPINFGGRFEYLGAVQEHWPEVLRALHRDTFPVYQKWLQRHEKTIANERLSRLFAMLQRGALPEFQEVDQALRKWADAHYIRDTWMRDAAVQTMHTWAHGAAVTKCIYLAEELGHAGVSAALWMLDSSVAGMA